MPNQTDNRKEIIIMTITLYITDNELRVERAISMSEKSYCTAREDGMASIEYSEATVKLMVTHRLKFILDIPVGAPVPTYVALTPHPDNAIYGTNWYVPVYWKPEPAVYDVEYKTTKGEYKYKDRLSLKKLEEGIEQGFNITRIFSETGLTQEFLAKFNLRIITKNKFRYAVKKKVAQ